MNCDRRLRLLLCALLATALWAHGERLLAAAKILGPSKCTSCHDHEKQAAWAGKDKHAQALQQLEDKKAAGYAKAIGLADPYDLKGSCVGCHATIFNGDANAGVSCETCHGPGSDYVQPHQEKGTHARSVTLGLFDTRGNLQIWAKMCLDCHIVKDAKLIAAGHKSGADFDAGASSQKIVHWVPTYDWAKLSALSAAGKGAAAARGSAPAPKAEAPKPPSAAPAAAPAPTKPPAPTASKAPAAEARPTARPAAEAKPAVVPAATVPPAAPPPTAAPAREAPAEPTPPAPASAPASAAATPEIAIVIEATPIPPRAPTSAPAPREPQAPSAAPPAPAPPGEPPATANPQPPAPRPPTRRPTRRSVTPKAPSAASSTLPAAPSPTLTPTKRPAPVLPQHAPN